MEKEVICKVCGLTVQEWMGANNICVLMSFPNGKIRAFRSRVSEELFGQLKLYKQFIAKKVAESFEEAHKEWIEMQKSEKNKGMDVEQ